MGARTSRSGKIKVHVASKSTVALYVVLSVLAAITVFALVVMDYGKVSFPAAMAAAVEDFVTMMTQPGLGGHFTLPDVIEGLFVSLALALLTTFIGAVIAFVLGLLAGLQPVQQGHEQRHQGVHERGARRAHHFVGARVLGGHRPWGRRRLSHGLCSTAWRTW